MTKPLLTRRNFMALSGLCAFGAISELSSCSSPEENSQSDKIQFVLDYVPNTNHTGVYVALEKDFYKKVGLDVEVVQPPEDGADALVASNKAQFGVSYQDVMANYLGSNNPLPNTAVAAILQHNTSGIMSAKSSNITRPKDMDNHSYATWNMEVEQEIVKSVITTDGGNWNSVKLVPCNTTDEVASLKAKEFDSVWVFEGWACQNARLQKFDYNYFSFAKIDDVFDYYTPVIIASNDYLENNPKQARVFLQATKEGYEYAVENPEEAADILCKAVPELDPELVKLSQQYLANQYIAEAKSWGVINEERWNAFYNWMNEHNLVEKEIPENTGFTTKFLG